MLCFSLEVWVRLVIKMEKFLFVGIYIFVGWGKYEINDEI